VGILLSAGATGALLGNTLLLWLERLEGLFVIDSTSVGTGDAVDNNTRPDGDELGSLDEAY